MKKYLIIVIVMLFFSFLLSACQKKNIEGEVIDNFNQPISGVSVSIINTSFNAVTDLNGKYEIDYVPGDLHLNYEKSGYLSQNLNINIASKEKYPAKKIEMIKVPSGTGVYFADKGAKDYIEVNRGNLDAIESEERNEYGGWISNMVTFNATGNFSQISGNGSFIINNYIGDLVLFQLQDESGTFSTERFQWQTEYTGIKPNVSISNFPNLKIITTKLNKGKYVFATRGGYPYLKAPIFVFEIK